MENYILLLWKSSLNLLELEQKVGHSWASNSQNRLPNKVRREWPENMVKTSQWRVTQWRDLWLIGQSFSVLESVFIPSDDQIPAWEEQTTILPMCIGQGPWDPQRPPCRHEPGEQIKKSPWLSSRIQTWSGASFKMTSASASSSENAWPPAPHPVYPAVDPCCNPTRFHYATKCPADSWPLL